MAQPDSNSALLPAPDPQSHHGARDWLWVQEAVQGGNEAGPCWWPPEKQATKYAEAISSLKEDKQLIHKQILQSRPTI